MQENAIFHAIAQKEESGMAACMNQYARLLWKVASAVLDNVGNAQDVEECVADTFIYLWQHPEKFDPSRGNLKSFLCILVRSRAIDRCRQLLRQDTVSLEEAVLAVQLEMQDAFIQKESSQELLSAVQDLGQPTCDILLRRYYYDQKPREIALALGLTVKQVNNALYRAKRQLRKTLKSR